MASPPPLPLFSCSFSFHLNRLVGNGRHRRYSLWEFTVELPPYPLSGLATPQGAARAVSNVLREIMPFMTDAELWFLVEVLPLDLRDRAAIARAQSLAEPSLSEFHSVITVTITSEEDNLQEEGVTVAITSEDNLREEGGRGVDVYDDNEEEEEEEEEEEGEEGEEEEEAEGDSEQACTPMTAQVEMTETAGQDEGSGEDGGGGEEESTCAICLEKMAAAGQEILWTPCSHSFHGACIRKWLRRKPQCPLCRFHW